MNTIIRKAILCVVLSLCFTPMARAIMANPNPITITQPDGTQLTIRIHGDESFHYITTIDGYLIKRDNDGYFRYFDFENNQLVAQKATNPHAR
ncbi:MAG: hypothetical protein E7084_06950, partial [Bacteroidales bacterium]|nr:hypothetical protein [Bacteroidales bacterium]